MPADPDDIAKYTNDGVVITAEDLSLKAAHPDAVDLGGEEKEMFFVDPDDAQILLDETLSLRSKPDPIHVGVEVDESLSIGNATPIAPTVPCYRYIDEASEQDAVARTRAFAYESGSDRYSVELLE